jgi:elongation factor P
MTIQANKLKPGLVIKWQGTVYKVMDTEMRGTGKSSKMCQSKLHDIANNTNIEHRFDGAEKLDDIHLEQKDYQYLYNDENLYYFMDPETFEQLSIDEEVIGKIVNFLKPETMIKLEFYEGKPINVIPPEFVILEVVTAPPSIKDSNSTTDKEVELENGIKILAPQFSKEGDKVRVDWAHSKYVDRVKEES